jgi:uncharacterized membrane protein YgaE (UPF0421/DUF939 family)
LKSQEIISNKLINLILICNKLVKIKNVHRKFKILKNNLRENVKFHLKKWEDTDLKEKLIQKTNHLKKMIRVEMTHWKNQVHL